MDLHGSRWVRSLGHFIYSIQVTPFKRALLHRSTANTLTNDKLPSMDLKHYIGSILSTELEVQRAQKIRVCIPISVKPTVSSLIWQTNVVFLKEIRRFGKLNSILFQYGDGKLL